MKKPEKLRLFWVLFSLFGLLIVHWVSPDGLLAVAGLTHLSFAAIFDDGVRPFLIIGLILLVILWEPKFQKGLGDAAEQLGMRYQSESNHVITMMTNPWIAMSQPDKEGERLSATDIFFQGEWPAIFNFSFSVSSLFFASNAMVFRQTVFCFKNDRPTPKFRLIKEANIETYWVVKDALGALNRMRELEAENINKDGVLFDRKYHIEGENEQEVGDFFAAVDKDAVNLKFPVTLVVEATEHFMIFYHVQRVFTLRRSFSGTNIKEEYERCQRLHMLLMGEETR